MVSAALLIGLACGATPVGVAFAGGSTPSTNTTAGATTATAQSSPAKPAQQQPAQQKPPPAPKPPPDNTELLPASEVMPLLGSKVRDETGEDMGMVVDIVVDRDGKPRALVIDFGGFLGVGSRKIAIDWRLVHFQRENKDAPVLLHLGRAEVQAAPEFVPGVEPLRMLGPPAILPASPNAGQ
ncbi:MAG TPA: PRC-barrel domain-containing protein [Dongiaceae bacterium]|nr:PRC-barrel domain-containing protein [Dongiaceae bacterium]